MVTPLNLADFDVTKERGFLPKEDPLRRLNHSFDELEEVAGELSSLLVCKKVRARVKKMRPLDAKMLLPEEYERAHMLSAFLANGCMWENWGPRDEVIPIIPAPIAKLLVAVAKINKRYPTLSYVSYAMNNWRRLDPNGPIELGNITLLQHFFGGLDEEWFILPHNVIEVKAGPAVTGSLLAQEMCMCELLDVAEFLLAEEVFPSLKEINVTLARIPEGCNPYIYYRRVRPPIHGWENNPAVPDGVVYEGVEEYGGKPQKFRGETGAQSSIFPLLDATLGVRHRKSNLSDHLEIMRMHMPVRHRELIVVAESRPPIRSWVKENKRLAEAYNACLEEMATFRKIHRNFAEIYINKQAQVVENEANPTDIGTGGTPFMESLKKHRDETLEAKV